MNNDELTHHFHLLARRVTRVEQELWPHTVVPEAAAPTGSHASAGAEPATEGDAASVIADHSRRVPAAPLSEEWIRLTIADQERSLRERLKEAEQEIELTREAVTYKEHLLKEAEAKLAARERTGYAQAVAEIRAIRESAANSSWLRDDITGWLNQRLTQPANRSAEECK
jgi:hypothetical protein